MARLRRLTATVLALGVVLAGAASSASGATTGTIRICTEDVAAAQGLSRYDYVVLNAWNHGLVARLKAENPSIKVLVYKDMASTRSYAVSGGVDDEFLPAGVGYADANANHPGWFLTDSGGNRVEMSGWPGQWWMDVGDSGYQQAWLTNVAAELAAYGWDGVVIDNMVADPAVYLGGRQLAKYPTPASYQAATRGFLAAVGRALTARGFLVLPNIPPVDRSLWGEWIRFTSGAVFEHWTKWSGAPAGSGYIDGGSWKWHADLLRATEQQGKIFLASTTSSSVGDVKTMEYARASFLLWSRGNPSAFVFNVCNQDPWSETWTVDLGQPLGPPALLYGVWKREYTGGIVLVNPETRSRSVRLLRSYYSPTGARPIRTATLEPTSGLILRTEPTGQTPAPSTPAPTPTADPPATAPVGAAPVGEISLRARLTVTNRAAIVLLSWTGTVGTPVIYRDGLVVRPRISGDSAAYDILARRGSYAYQVVDASSAGRASNVVTVTY